MMLTNSYLMIKKSTLSKNEKLQCILLNFIYIILFRYYTLLVERFLEIWYVSKKIAYKNYLKVYS